MGAKRFIKKLLFLNANDDISVITIMKRWNIRFGHYLYKKKYCTEDIMAVLRSMGVGRGSNIFIHSSWDSFYNYTGNEKELLDALISLIGEEGTIAMPSFPVEREGKIFDVRRTMTRAGMLNELFRRYPGVKRSISVRNPVCALGPLADFVTNDHLNALVCWDEHSPYYKICEKNFTVVKLGLPKYFIGSFQYCSKAIMRHDIPYFAQFYDENSYDINHYIDWDGKEKTYKSIVEKPIYYRESYLWVGHIIRKYIPKDKYLFKRLSGLNISCIDCNFIHKKFCELAKQNIFFYSIPIVKKSQML